ncbi:hypothetical protein [uncultured Shewanella sp.]|uniref:hypothetical protein n=1 Tax=uncultured Shewanella sp. TaxID=173975 RepID=UPI00261D71FC|nr:hypothetical protein [uncultured Shewanella sp.]
MKIKKVLAVVAFSLLFSSNAGASDWVTITDMSQLKYQIKDGQVWLRNVNEFNESWLGCCYAYYIDITADEGKAIWSAMLAQMAMGKPYNIGVVDKSVNGSKIIMSGNW